jgi:ABC-2 type transport system permease protein
MLKKYLALTKGGFKTAIAYRFHFYTTVVLAPISLIIYYFLWRSIFSYSGQEIIKGFTFQSMINYYSLSIIMGILVYSFVDSIIEEDVIYGNLITALLRPVHLLPWYYLFEAGFIVLSVILELIPVFIISIFFFGLKLAPLPYLLFFILSILLAIQLNYLIAYLTGLSAFWLKRIGGIRKFRRVIVSFLSGGIIPLTFFPDKFQFISRILPFEHIRFTPINIYLGNYTTNQILFVIGSQIVWILVLYLITKIVWSRALKRFTGAGT